ncbi:MAG: sigma-70 family RNA polymerase sigma factor [Planctomycetota bacterium]
MEISPTHNASFAEMLARFRSGDANAADEIFKTLRPALVSRARAIIHPAVIGRADASDIAQEAMVAANAGINTFRGETEDEFSAWLMKILVNLARQANRHHHADRRNVASEVPLQDQAPRVKRASPLSEMMQMERFTTILCEIDRLPPAMRDVIIRRVFHNQPFDSIAAETGKTASNARVLWTRGLRKLRDAMAQSGPCQPQGDEHVK